MSNDRIPPNPYPVKPPPNIPAPRKESLESENARLKAEVERLTKAGDTMANVLCFTLGLSGEEPRFVKDWNAAKEGKQSK
jgi:hypothetical protein